MTVTVAGISLGLIAAVFATRTIAGLMFGVDRLDPVTFAGVAVLLAAVALLACYRPARAAATVDPMTLLR
jgi:uncharacterized membrane protein